MTEENVENAVNDAQEMNVESQLPQTRSANGAFAAMRKREQLAMEKSREAENENESLRERISAMEDEAKELKSFRARALIGDDLKMIKEKYPDFCADIDSLPEDYIRIMATGAVDALTAAEIVEAKRKKAGLIAPESIGALGGGTPDKEYYTPDEVDKISRRELRKNPGLMKKIQNSMTKWR